MVPLEQLDNISIHVPREGDDAQAQIIGLIAHDISIHVPREGDDCPMVISSLLS